MCLEFLACTGKIIGGGFDIECSDGGALSDRWGVGLQLVS